MITSTACDCGIEGYRTVFIAKTSRSSPRRRRYATFSILTHDVGVDEPLKSTDVRFCPTGNRVSFDAKTPSLPAPTAIRCFHRAPPREYRAAPALTDHRHAPAVEPVVQSHAVSRHWSTENFHGQGVSDTASSTFDYGPASYRSSTSRFRALIANEQ